MDVPASWIVAFDINCYLITSEETLLFYPNILAN